MRVLLDVQEHDTAIGQLEHRRGHLPEQAALDAKMAAIAELEGRKADLDAQLHDLGRSQKRLEDEVASLQNRIVEVDQLLYSGAVAAPKELSALQDELRSLRKREDRLETDQLELMETREPIDAEVADLEASHTAAQAEAQKLEVALAEALVDVDAELAGVQDERTALVADIDAGLLSSYDELRGRLQGVAVAALVGGVCGGCHLTLSAMEIDRIKKQPEDAVVHCEECGRILVR